MKKDLDIETMLSKLRIKKLDQAIEDACHNKLVSYFSDLAAKESLKKQPNEEIKRLWTVYTTAIVVLSLIIGSVFFYSNQVTNAKEKTRAFLLNKYHRISISNIFIDLHSRKSIVDIPNKRLVCDLSTGSLYQVINPIQIELTEEEKKIAQDVLKKDSCSYFVSESKIIDEVTNGYTIYSFCFGSKESAGGNEEDFIKIEKISASTEDVYGIIILYFYPVDPIVQINGYQYPGSETKFAKIEVLPNKFIGLRTFFCIDINRKEMVGPYVEKVGPYVDIKK